MQGGGSRAAARERQLVSADANYESVGCGWHRLGKTVHADRTSGSFVQHIHLQQQKRVGGAEA